MGNLIAKLKEVSEIIEREVTFGILTTNITPLEEGKEVKVFIESEPYYLRKELTVTERFEVKDKIPKTVKRTRRSGVAESAVLLLINALDKNYRVTSRQFLKMLRDEDFKSVSTVAGKAMKTVSERPDYEMTYGPKAIQIKDAENKPQGNGLNLGKREIPDELHDKAKELDRLKKTNNIEVKAGHR